MNRDEIEAANARVVEAGAFVQPLLAEAGKVIVGQHYLMERLDKNYRYRGAPEAE